VHTILTPTVAAGDGGIEYRGGLAQGDTYRVFDSYGPAGLVLQAVVGDRVTFSAVVRLPHRDIAKAYRECLLRGKRWVDPTVSAD